MKSQLLSISAAVSLGVLSVQGMAADKTLNDLFMEKDKHIYVIAERPDESLAMVNCTGGIMFFGDSMDKEALVEYCASVGGTASLSEPPRQDSFKSTFISRHANVTCKAPNNKGFTASFFHPKYSSDDYSYAWLHVKYDAPQPTGYNMKAYYKEWVEGKYSKAEDFGKDNHNNNYYSGSFLKGPSMCAAKGGKYLMATEETQGYAVDLNDYLFAIANKIGAFENEFADGQHWCVDTKDPADEFTVTSYKGRFYREFKASMGVNRADIKIFNGKGLPPYYMKNSDRTEDGAADNAPVSDSVKMSRTSTPAIASLAAKTTPPKPPYSNVRGERFLRVSTLGKMTKGACSLPSWVRQTSHTAKKAL